MKDRKKYRRRGRDTSTNTPATVSIYIHTHGEGRNRARSFHFFFLNKFYFCIAFRRCVFLLGALTFNVCPCENYHPPVLLSHEPFFFALFHWGPAVRLKRNLGRRRGTVASSCPATHATVSIESRCVGRY